MKWMEGNCEMLMRKVFSLVKKKNNSILFGGVGGIVTSAKIFKTSIILWINFLDEFFNKYNSHQFNSISNHYSNFPLIRQIPFDWHFDGEKISFIAHMAIS
ncbi:hypothetical protein ACKWTF_004951 [Chironomus riparius]